MENNDQKLQITRKPSEFPYYLLILLLYTLTVVLSPLPRLVDNWGQKYILTCHTSVQRQESGIEELAETQDKKKQEIEKLDKENSRLEEIYKEKLSIYEELKTVPDNEAYSEWKEELLERNRVLTEEALKL